MAVTSHPLWHSTPQDKYCKKTRRTALPPNRLPKDIQATETGLCNPQAEGQRRRIGSAEPPFKADCMYADCRLASRFSAFARRHLMGWWCVAACIHARRRHLGRVPLYMGDVCCVLGRCMADGRERLAYAAGMEDVRAEEEAAANNRFD